jgi:hypothetical protein
MDEWWDRGASEWKGLGGWGTNGKSKDILQLHGNLCRGYLYVCA